MRLKLARWIVDLEVSPAALASVIAQRYADFACALSAEADFHIEVRHEPLPADSPDVGGSLLGVPLLAMGENYLLDGPQFYGIIEVNNRRAALHTCSVEPAREVEYFFRIVLALFALQHDGLLVHCAALRRDGRVHLFIGQSGSGKSTVVALSRAAGRAMALGDDLALLRKEDRGWQAYGTPFWNPGATGRDGQAGDGRVTGIYKLVQDLADFVEPMSQAAATAELVANCPIVNDQPALLPGLIDRCREISGAVAVRRLHFRKDDAFWDAILQEVP